MCRRDRPDPAYPPDHSFWTDYSPRRGEWPVHQPRHRRGDNPMCKWEPNTDPKPPNHSRSHPYRPSDDRPFAALLLATPLAVLTALACKTPDERYQEAQSQWDQHRRDQWRDGPPTSRLVPALAMCSGPDDAADPRPGDGRSPETYGRDFNFRPPRFFQRLGEAVADSWPVWFLGFLLKGGRA